VRRAVSSLVCIPILGAGICFGQANYVEVKLPPNVNSEAVFVYYALAGAPMGNWIRPLAGTSSYLINTMFEGHAANGMKALIYAPGCAIQALDIPLTGSPNEVYDFLCEPSGNLSISGRVLWPDRLYGRRVQLQARYIARWVASFLRLPNEFELPITVGDAPFLTADGRFRMSIPDLSRDALAGAPDHPGEILIWARDPATAEVLAQLVPIEPREFKIGMGGLKIQSDYAPEVVFAPCDVPRATTHDREGFAIRPDVYGVCDR
jgi:hypothetical protein